MKPERPQTTVVSATVPVGAYADDRSITVFVTRTNATANAFVNEIALEELTLTAESRPPRGHGDSRQSSRYRPGIRS